MISHSPVSSTSRSPTCRCIGSTRVVLEDAGCRGVGNGSCPASVSLGLLRGPRLSHPLARLQWHPPSLARSVGSWLTYRVIVVPVPGTRGPYPSPRALGRVIGPRPSRSAVEPLLGMPRRRAAELLVPASKHAAFVLPLPMLLNDPRIRVEVVPDNRPANACLIEARHDGVLETRVARRKCVSHTRSMRTAGQHERYHDDHGPHRVGSCFFNASHAARCVACHGVP